MKEKSQIMNHSSLSKSCTFMQLVLTVILLSTSTNCLASAPSIVNNNENTILKHSQSLQNIREENQFLTEKEKVKDFEIILHEYLKESLSKNTTIVLIPGIELVPQIDGKHKNVTVQEEGRHSKTATELVIKEIEKFADEHVLTINVPRAIESGRLFFFKGIFMPTKVFLVLFTYFSFLIQHFIELKFFLFYFRIKKTHVARVYWNTNRKNNFIGTFLAKFIGLFWKNFRKR